MAKRTSFEQKNKHIHKSRKVIIDTVFGRTDDNQNVFGYEKEAEKKREVGEVWVDSDGKEWEQKEGFKINTTKMDEIRDYLKKITTCSSEDCKTIQYSNADKKLIAKTGLCTTCLARHVIHNPVLTIVFLSAVLYFIVSHFSDEHLLIFSK